MADATTLNGVGIAELSAFETTFEHMPRDITRDMADDFRRQFDEARKEFPPCMSQPDIGMPGSYLARLMRLHDDCPPEADIQEYLTCFGMRGGWIGHRWRVAKATADAIKAGGCKAVFPDDESSCASVSSDEHEAERSANA